MDRDEPLQPSPAAGTAGRADVTRPTEQTLVYIGGYGRSGSTLLALVLAEDEHTLNLGEVAMAAPLLRTRKRLCTCGRPLVSCPVWSSLAQPAGRGSAAHLELLRSAFAATPAPVIIDASKTAFRHARHPGYLRRRLGARLRMLHVVRDPRAVAWSVLRERRRDGGPQPRWGGLGLAARTAAGWMLANLVSEWFGLRHRRDYVRLRYEDAVTAGVPDAFGLRLPAGPLAGRTLMTRRDNVHAPVGNPMRRVGSATVRLDAEWRTALSPRLAAVVCVLCLPLMLRYRYLGGRPSSVVVAP